MTSGKRISAPAMMGMDSIKPFYAGQGLKVLEMKGAIVPWSTQMQHEKESYKNEVNSVGAWPLFRKLQNPDTAHSS